MSRTEHPEKLGIPLYKLYYIDDVRGDVVLDEESLAQFSQDYTEEQIREIKEALEWGKSHPDYDFTAVLPNLRHSNEDIYYYIVAVLERIRTIT